MGRQAQAQQQGVLWWKIATVLSTLGSLLLGALAYNLGSIHQSSKDQQIAESETMINNVLHKKLDMCNEQLKSKVENEKWIQELQEEEKLIHAESTILSETLDYHRDAAEACELELAAKELERQTLSDQQLLINKLEFENTMMELNFNNVTNTKTETRATHRLFIRAIRLENELLRMELKKKEAVEQALLAAEQEREEARKRLQKEDTGLGEVDDHTENEKLSNLQKSLNSIKASDYDREEKQFEDEDPDEWEDVPPPPRRTSESEEGREVPKKSVEEEREEPPRWRRRRKVVPTDEEAVVEERRPRRRRRPEYESEAAEEAPRRAPRRREVEEEEVPRRAPRRRRVERPADEEEEVPRRRRSRVAEEERERSEEAPRRRRTRVTEEEPDRSEEVPRRRRRRREE
eukprot:TRINITY_DN2808_c0_g1_i2.p1 TRINITY_DN2808_c0_g1~~TRINITY_DN2808_c0_g1_i2.p1  ORF type:complete len:405 (+),score=119.85 TRINITY_DN2808_c0_g1_i2:78-1292(+)